MNRVKNLPQIDSLYVYNLNHKTVFTHRHQETDGYEYQDRHAILRTDANGIHIYHMSAEIKGVIKGLTMVTLDSDVKRVEKFFKDSIKDIHKDINKSAIFYTARKPVQIGCYYMY